MTSAGAGNDSQNKSANAFKTISEVARFLDVPQHVLRFWETKFTQIKPMKRAGGRRYYRPEDVDLLSAIRQLLHAEGYTIRGVQKMMREKGVKSILSVSQNPSEQITPSDPSDLSAPGAVVAKSSVTISASLKMSDTQKAELSAIRDDLLAIRSGLVGGSN